ncbi:MAG: sigma-54-dependent Fis family transcriptional regulator [Verrucomicrobiales bacterium]|nr:sigma-54-dependent Fis family transcriptional regulator [Verrucomicrobiales bacterium]
MDKLLIIDDEVDIQRSFRRLLEGQDIEVHTASSGEEALDRLPGLAPDLVIMDVRMGGMSGLETLRRIREADARLPVIMMTAYGTTQTAIEAMKLGAFDYLLKPFDIPKLKELISGALRAARQMKAVVAFEPLLESADYELGIVGRSGPMQTVFKLVGQLAASEATALITGESGTGKELVARAIYSHSSRSRQPFVAINCAAIPENLLESELFGHEKGAFTGAAQQRIGKFEQCNHGTIFLDEIGDMPLATQTKILRVLQSGTFERVGGNETVKVDVRVIAATNKPLEQAVAARAFREDLFYRLNVVRLPLPPLRERRDDIPLLVDYFLRKFAKESGRAPKAVVPDVVRALEAHPWPGNVRELENALRRASVVATGEAILTRDLPPEVLSSLAMAGAGTVPGSAVMSVVPTVNLAGSNLAPVASVGDEDEDESDLSAVIRTLFQWARQNRDFKVLPAVERELVIEALKDTKGNQVQAAKLLGITRATLRKRIDKFGIRKDLVIQ